MSARQFPARPFVWLVHVALPLLGLWVLIRRPHVDHDLMWQHQGPHFWLVLVTAVISSVLAIKAALEARRHDDARLFLVGMSFLIAVGVPRAARARHADRAHRRVELRLRARRPGRAHARGDPGRRVGVPARRFRPVVVRHAPLLLGARVRPVRGLGRLVARAVAAARRPADGRAAPVRLRRVRGARRDAVLRRGGHLLPAVPETTVDGAALGADRVRAARRSGGGDARRPELGSVVVDVAHPHDDRVRARRVRRARRVLPRRIDPVAVPSGRARRDARPDPHGLRDRRSTRWSSRSSRARKARSSAPPPASRIASSSRTRKCSCSRRRPTRSATSASGSAASARWPRSAVRCR